MAFVTVTVKSRTRSLATTATVRSPCEFTAPERRADCSDQNRKRRDKLAFRRQEMIVYRGNPRTHARITRSHEAKGAPGQTRVKELNREPRTRRLVAGSSSSLPYGRTHGLSYVLNFSWYEATRRWCSGSAAPTGRRSPTGNARNPTPGSWWRAIRPIGYRIVHPSNVGVSDEQ